MFYKTLFFIFYSVWNRLPLTTRKLIGDCIQNFRKKYLIKTFQSGLGQDYWVIHTVFNYKKNGFFVEAGAADGVSGSNSYILEHSYDWTGICVEPNPLFYDELVKNRKCITSSHCLGEDEETIEYIIKGGHSGIVADDTDNAINKPPKIINSFQTKNEIISMKTISLDKLMLYYNAPSVIDYLSLDVEGAETRVFKHFDFSKYTFLCLTIERPTAELNNLLFNNGYHFVKNQLWDTFYVHESIPNFKLIKKSFFKQVNPKFPT